MTERKNGRTETTGTRTRLMLALIGLVPFDLSEADGPDVAISTIRNPSSIERLAEPSTSNRIDWVIAGPDANDRDISRFLESARLDQGQFLLAMLGPAEDRERCVRWLHRGCRIYLRDSTSSQNLVRALLSTTQDTITVDSAFYGHGAEEARPDPLSPREHQVLGLLLHGRSNDQIARRLSITRSTVEFHLKRIYGKLGVSNRLEATLRAQQLGL